MTTFTRGKSTSSDCLYFLFLRPPPVTRTLVQTPARTGTCSACCKSKSPACNRFLLSCLCSGSSVPEGNPSRAAPTPTWLRDPYLLFGDPSRSPSVSFCRVGPFPLGPSALSSHLDCSRHPIRLPCSVCTPLSHSIHHRYAWSSLRVFSMPRSLVWYYTMLIFCL